MKKRASRRAKTSAKEAGYGEIHVIQAEASPRTLRPHADRRARLAVITENLAQTTERLAGSAMVTCQCTQEKPRQDSTIVSMPGKGGRGSRQRHQQALGRSILGKGKQMSCRWKTVHALDACNCFKVRDYVELVKNEGCGSSC